MALQKPKRARAKKAGRISFSKIAYNDGLFTLMGFFFQPICVKQYVTCLVLKKKKRRGDF
jgi:hypothetical protein